MEGGKPENIKYKNFKQHCHPIQEGMEFFLSLRERENTAGEDSKLNDKTTFQK